MGSPRSAFSGRLVAWWLCVALAVVGSACKDDGLERVVYDGETGPATVDASNAAELFEVLFSWPRIPPTASVGDQASAPGAELLAAATMQVLRSEIAPRPASASAAPSVSGVEPPRAGTGQLKFTIEREIPGRVGGRIVLDGAVDILGRGRIEYVWKGFDDGFGHRVDGRAKLVIEEVGAGGRLVDGRLLVERVEFFGAGLDRAVSGTIGIRALTGDTERLTLDLHVRDVTAGRSHRLVGLELTSRLAYDGTPITESYEGRLYVDRHGWVDVSTGTPLAFDGSESGFAILGGPVVVEGEGGGRGGLVPGLARRVRVEVDESGGGVWQKEGVYDWAGIGTITLPNTPPVLELIGFDPDPAIKGADLYVDLLLDDAERDPLDVEYEWRIEDQQVPDEHGPGLSSDLFVRGDRIDVTVTVSDGELEVSASDSITVANAPPVADAGPDLVLPFDTLVELDGRASRDDDGDEITSEWQIVEEPRRDARATIDSPEDLLTSVRLDVQGTWTFELTVSDGVASTSDRVEVEIVPTAIFDPEIEVVVVDSTLGENVLAAAIGDVTGDGLDDVVVLANDSHPARTFAVVLAQEPDGGLSEPVQHLLHESYRSLVPTRIDAADVNGDERIDVVAVLRAGVVVLYQQADGSLGEAVLYPHELAGEASTAIGGVADPDGDGLNDVVAFTSVVSDFDASVRHQQPDGTLGEIVDLELANRPVALAVGDLDGDERDDVILTRSKATDLLGELEDGSLDVRELYADSDAVAVAVAVGDVDGDGRKDIVEATWEHVAVRLQLENGELGAEQILPRISAANRTDVGISDVDLDGRPDIVIGQSHYGVGVHLQREDGTFMAEQRYHGQYRSSNVLRIAIGDVTGDGRHDVVSAWGRSISVLPGRAPSP